MPESPGKSPGSSGRPPALEITLLAAPGRFRTGTGVEIPFAQALLTFSNLSPEETMEFVPHASFGQQGGTCQDVSGALASAPVSLAPGGSVHWDVYERVLPAHPGTASKVRLFGYRAALNWDFDLVVWAEYRLSGSADPVRTPLARWTLRWSVPDPASGAVALSIEEKSG